MRNVIFIAAVCAAFGLAGCAESDEAGGEITTNVNMADDPAMDDALGAAPAGPAAFPTDAQGFANAVAASDLFEIESAKLAREKGQSDYLRGFGQMLEREHQASSASLRSAAAAADVTVSPALDSEKQAMIDELRAASGAAFDSTFIDQQRMAHQKALMLLQNYQASGDNEALKAFAAEAQRMVEDHVDRLNAMRN